MQSDGSDSRIERCGCSAPDDYWPDATNRVAREIAHGIEHGSWACEHVNWTNGDAADAWQYLYEQEVRRRDRLRDGIHDLERDGIVPVERGDAILSSAGLPPCSIRRAALRAARP